jgi:hypothetical protein
MSLTVRWAPSPANLQGKEKMNTLESHFLRRHMMMFLDEVVGDERRLDQCQTEEEAAVDLESIVVVISHVSPV